MSSAATAVVQHAAKWTMDDLPDEIVCVFISQLDAETLMFIIPQVCKRWRALCQDVRNVHLNFSVWARCNSSTSTCRIEAAANDAGQSQQ